MTKTRITVAVVALSFAAAAFCFGATKTADPAASPAAAKSAKAMAPKKEAAKMAAANPHIGTWKLNEAKSKLVPGMGKNPTVVYAEQGDKIKVTVEGMDKDGKATHGVWVGKFDGKGYPAKGNMSWNSAAYKTVNDHTNDITTWKDGKMVWSGRITVAKDGKSRTVTMSGTGADGKKFKGKAVYDKA